MTQSNNRRNNARRSARNTRNTNTANPLPNPTANVLRSLPLRMGRGRRDLVPISVRGVWALQNSAAGVAALCVGLTPQALTGTNVIGLGDIFPVLSGMRGSFGEFTITRLVCSLKLNTPTDQIGVAAFCYENTDSTRNGAPVSIASAANGMHSAVVTCGESATIAVNPLDYYNEWLSCYASTADQRMEEAGILQFLSTNGQAQSINVAIMTIEVDMLFCGYKF